MGLVATAVSFVIGLLVGGIGIFISAKIFDVEESIEYAMWTALLGAITYAAAQFYLNNRTLVDAEIDATIGTFLPLIVYFGVIHFRYKGELRDTIAIALVAWLATAAVLYFVGPFFNLDLNVVGLPGL